MSAVITDIGELLPNAQTACRAFLELCESEGLKVRITETYRSQARQNELYAQGRTTPGSIVTWTKNSRHTARRAWDICQNIPGREYSDLAFFAACGALAEKLGITWGGNWSTPDRPHFEVTAAWSLPEDFEVIDMERLEALEQKMTALTEKIEKIEAALPKVYTYTQDVPEWGRKTVQRLLDMGYFAGRAPDDLNLSDDMLRLFVILERVGIFG